MTFFSSAAEFLHLQDILQEDRVSSTDDEDTCQAVSGPRKTETHQDGTLKKHKCQGWISSKHDAIDMVLG
jgi:hypothetical protein